MSKKRRFNFSSAAYGHQASVSLFPCVSSKNEPDGLAHLPNRIAPASSLLDQTGTLCLLKVDPNTLDACPIQPVPERLFPAGSGGRLTRRLRNPLKTLFFALLNAVEAFISLFWGRIGRRIDGQKGEGAKIAIYVHYATTRRVSAMVEKQVAAYARLGLEVIFVTACRTLPPQDIARLRPLCRAIVFRRNFALDFGAWRDVALSKFFPRDGVKELLLVNDSVLGPIRPLEPIFETMRQKEGLWGLTDSRQFCSHLQSYFLFARGEPAVKAVHAFLTRMRLSSDKETTIALGELKISQNVARTGVPVYSLFGTEQVTATALQEPHSRYEIGMSIGHDVPGLEPPDTPKNRDAREMLRLRRAILERPLNPTHQLAEPLVRKFGFPFIKKELIVINPCKMTIALDWRSLVTEESPCSVEMIDEHLCQFSYKG